ncbi:isoflavone reductase family protein [Cucurbitaria berberidis CBS 394.84]|uniref:Isoflavone reductase family protein n=1 Tax=Cucurbitaria berberidis CBS 394.84 TaxID=1168544 RepID=A0A9P4GV53_9PLEO|nr:isoflavone reductase family protein [Cucurbitaria berberidis CBS 394.84]KAF1852136.1 isoflavone reductase family protein [Cucurbitaria berberidis CBS 394.84]
MSIKNVIIIGAGGNLGPAILNAFLKESSFNTTVLSRKDSKSTFPSGVKVINADYDSASSLRDAFQGQDAVISLVGSGALGDQNKLIDASIAAGVKRFIPSEFGSNVPNKRAREIVPIFAAKYETVNYLKSKESEISWTSVITGPFFDWGLKTGFLGFNASNKSVEIYDEGKAVFSTTNLHQIGLTLIKALEKADASKNQYVYVSSFQTTQQEVLAVAEKITGSKWTVTKVDATQYLKEGRERFAKGDYSSIPILLRGITFSVEEKLGDFSSEGLWNDKLGLPKESLEDTIKDVLSGKP